MENISNTIQAFEDLINTPEKQAGSNTAQITEQNLKILPPPVPHPPAPHPLPSIKDFNNVGFIGIHEVVEDNTVKTKMEELRILIMKSLAIINIAADVTAKKSYLPKSDIKAWVGFNYLPLIHFTKTVETTFTKTARSIDIAGEIFNIIKGFKAKEDLELIKFSEYLGKIARSFKPLKGDRFIGTDDNNDLMMLTYSVDISKQDNIISYQPVIKQFIVKLNNDVSGLRCENNSEVSVNLTISCSNYILDYETASQRDKDMFMSFLTRYDTTNLQKEPAHFEGYFKRA